MAADWVLLRLPVFSRRKVLQVLQVVCLLLSTAILFTLTSHKDTSNEEDLLLRLQFTQSLQQLLKDTPNLWRRPDTSNDTSTSRILSQRTWISSFSRTNYSRFTKRKRILVENQLASIYCTDGALVCPYAPHFQDACTVLHQTYEDVFTDSLKYSHVDAFVSKSTWIPQLYEINLPGNVLSVKYVLEPPHITKKVHLGRNNALLASYWRGSDIPIPYGSWLTPQDVSQQPYEPLNCQRSTGSLSSQTFQLQNKSGEVFVAAVISNCDDVNGRLEYVAELQKVIPVDVYGKCGSLSCPKREDTDNLPCMRHIEDTYKFYLAFENSNCEDYITEKLFVNGLKHAVVPVVMGAPKQNYLDLGLPSTSFIHVDDFASPRQLAEFLLHLSRNDDDYSAFFKDRRGVVSESPWADFFCRLCGLLYYAAYVPPPKWKSDALWETTNKCLPHFQRSWNNSHHASS